MSELTPEVKQYLEHDVGAVAVARVYAEALLNQAALQHQEQETLDDLEALLNQVFQAHPDLEEFLTGDAVGRESKGKVIEAAFANRCSELLSNFLHVLNDHDRLPLIRPIIYLYRTTLDKRRGRMRVVVRSAVPLVDHQARAVAGRVGRARSPGRFGGACWRLALRRQRPNPVKSTARRDHREKQP
jgi:ATP synthase F1 delta subunit